MAEPKKTETNDIAEPVPADDASPYAAEHPSQDERRIYEPAPHTPLPLQALGQHQIVDPGDAQPIHPDARL